MKRVLSILLSFAFLASVTGFAADETNKPVKPELPVQPADVAAPKLAPDGSIQAGFANAHENFVNVAKKGDAQVVFLGDSITARWNGSGKEVFKEYANYNAANFGIGGDRVQHVLWRVENGEFDGLKPKVVVLMIGTNNASVPENSPEQIANGIRKIIDAIHARSANTKILLLAIFPRGATPAKRVKNEAVNAIIAKYDDGKTVHYLNINTKFLTADGTLEKTIMPDLLHPNAAGYQIEADAIREKLASLVK